MACIRKRRGKWVADYRDGTTIRRWRAFDTKREAEDFLDRERPKTRQWSKPVVTPCITVEAYKPIWLQMIAATVKRRTLDSYTETFTNHILPVLARVQIRQLDRGSIKRFLAEKLTSGRFRKLANRENPAVEGLSRNSVRIIHAPCGPCSRRP